MGSLPGVETYSQPTPIARSRFRSSWTQPEGAVGAMVFEGVVTDINLVNWTVDVITKFDQRWFLNIQVCSPYLHSNRGEGMSAMPDIGAKCVICIPSDGPPPFVLGFIMPMETIDGSSDDAPAGTNGSKGAPTQNPTAASFAGGRTRAKPGDISIVNRDGSFVRLHRGGVLQIGSTALAQRIYVPLQNLINDISQNYRHNNTGGSINWFISPGENASNPPTTCRHTYQVLANDAAATVRIAIGKVSDVMKEPSDESRSDLTQLAIGTDQSEPIVCEVTVSPAGINAQDGAYTTDASKKSVLHYFFDAAGNTLFRTAGSVSLRVEKRLRLRVLDDVEIFGAKNFLFSFDGSGRIDAPKGLDINGGVMRLNGGTKAVATVGSLVTVTLALPVLIQTNTGPGTILAGQTMIGVISTGNPTILC